MKRVEWKRRHERLADAFLIASVVASSLAMAAAGENQKNMQRVH
jgi:hypothetical protein